MPAVELSRLRTQINGLIARFADPPGLCSALTDLLEQYANRAYRAGQAVQPQPLLPSYRVSALVMQQLELELGKTCQETPLQAAEVVEALWHDPFLEPRLLATHLLGSIPASHAEIVTGKIRAWAQPEENFRMLDALFRNGTRTLRRSAPPLLLQLYEEWLTAPRSDTQAMGIRALAALVEDPTFENLPAAFRMISGLVQSAPAALQTDLQAVLSALIRRSPTETAFFLRQSLRLAHGQGTARLVRRCLPLFTPAQQANLRAALQSSRST